MNRSETQSSIAPALVKALAEFRGVAKDSKNPHFKNDYASLEAVIDTARPILANHGLAFMQGLGEYASGVMSVSTLILHESGEWIETTSMMPVSKTDPQGTASASTYNRRYSLMSMLGLPAVDDDGNEASKPPTAPKAVTPPQSARPITERAAGLENALRTSKGADALDKSWSLGAGLLAQLETDDNARFKALEELYTELRVSQ